jgi:hypothetical protein
MKDLEENLVKEKQARLLLVETSGSEEYTAARTFYEAIGYTPRPRKLGFESFIKREKTRLSMERNF